MLKYKTHSSAKYVRAFLNEIANYFHKAFGVRGHYRDERPTFGDVLHSHSNPKIFNVLTTDQWSYLKMLNEHANRSLHETILAQDAKGIVKIVVPPDHCKTKELQRIAKIVGLVTKEKDFQVTMSDENSSDSSTSTTPEKKQVESSYVNDEMETSRIKRIRHKR